MGCQGLHEKGFAVLLFHRVEQMRSESFPLVVRVYEKITNQSVMDRCETANLLGLYHDPQVMTLNQKVFQLR